MSNDTPVSFVPPVIQTIPSHIPPAQQMVAFQPISSSMAQVQNTLAFNQDNLAALAVARAETALRERAASLRDEIASLKSQITTIEKRRADFISSLPALAETGAGPGFQPLADALQAFYHVVPRIRSTSGPTLCLTSNPPTYSVDLDLYPEHGSNFILRHTYTAALPSDNTYIADGEALAALRQLQTKAEADFLATRSALGNVETIERRAKAALAKHLVSATQEGKEMVAAMESAIDIDKLVEHLASF